MNHRTRAVSMVIALTILLSCFITPSFAAVFASTVNPYNLGVNTQYSYTENNPSWLRQLVLKEDLFTVEGLATELELHPVTVYPYRTDGPSFKLEVADYTEYYTLSEDSEKAAYIYLLQQIGALTLISEPTVDDQTKADWLREHGIVITAEEESDPDSILLIGALYALMRNDLYYVYTGQHLDFPEGTGLEEAVVIYLTALSGQNSTLSSFLQRYFSISRATSLEDYVYYTSLLALYTTGYVSIRELTTISHQEVYRRMAIMTIRKSGISIDSETATTEELQIKYLTAMMGQQYDVTLDPAAMQKAVKNDTVAYYILQRMAYEDAGIAIASAKYTYAECFNIVLKNTQRFKLENEFYSDIKEYDVYLGNKRKSIYLNPTPISSSGVKLSLNGAEIKSGEYTNVGLTDSDRQILELKCEYSGEKSKTTVYKLNIIQGTVPASEGDLTGFLSEIGTITVGDPTYTGTLPNLPELLTDLNGSIVVSGAVNGSLPSLPLGVPGILSVNSEGQLVDQNGNVVSLDMYETLPAGYKYVVDENGSISIALIDDTQTSVPASESEEETVAENALKWKGIIVAASLFFLIALVFIIIIVYKSTSQKKKKKKKKSKSPKKKSGKKTE